MSGTELKQRLVAILAADAAGYSRLMSLDERATVAALDASRSVFHAQTVANQGRVVDTAGDSVLAVFETAAGALNAAVQIQAVLAEAGKDVPSERRMQFRIGIHSGDVMEKADGSVYGDGVNIAARLQALAEPGQITVSDAIHGAVRGKVSATFIDQGEQTVKNIAHPVRAYRVQGGDDPASAAASAAKPVAGEIDLSLPDKPSIAVLAFTNMSGDPEQEYFTDGITEDIITELSRFHSLFVIARNSSFTYKGKAVDVRTVSKELGVRYVVEGSIRRAVNRIRVTAQLIDAITGNHIWAEKYDRVLEDVFAVQEEVTQCIVAAIAPQIEGAERDKARQRRPENFSAYDIALRANAKATEAWRETDPQLWDVALDEARQALHLDPRSTLALNVIALLQTHYLFVFDITEAQTRARLQEGVAAATKAIEVDPSDSVAYGYLGSLLAMAGRWAEALVNARRGPELNPSDSLAWSQLSFVELLDGQHQSALEHSHRASRLNPVGPRRYSVNAMRAAACFFLRNYTLGLDYARLAVSEAPNSSTTHLNHVLVAVGAADMAAARAAFESARRLAPGHIQKRLAGRSAYRDPQDQQRTTSAFRIAAGLEDPSAADAWR